MMNVWDWIDEFYEEALRNGDEERARLPEIHAEGYEHRETNPQQTLALFEEGTRLSQRLQEEWWMLFFNDWCVSAYLFFLRDYRDVLDKAVKNMLEMRKPHYDQFPMRLSVQRNLVHAYISIDPSGYAEQIESSLAHLENGTPPDSEDQYLILGSRREHALELNHLELAERMVTGSLSLADNDDDLHAAYHYSTFSYSGLCEIAWRRREWETLKDAAREGELTARQSGLQMELTEFLLWQAVVARQEGREELARYLHRRAMSRVKRLQMPPDRAFYDALCGFYLLSDESGKAMRARQRELRTVSGMGRLWYEARAWLQVCQLLAQNNELTPQNLVQARSVISRLRHPEIFLQQLDQIA